MDSAPDALLLMTVQVTNTPAERWSRNKPCPPRVETNCLYHMPRVKRDRPFLLPAEPPPVRSLAAGRSTVLTPSFGTYLAAGVDDLRVSAYAGVVQRSGSSPRLPTDRSGLAHAPGQRNARKATEPEQPPAAGRGPTCAQSIERNSRVDLAVRQNR